MTEEEARPALLQTEIDALRKSISGLDVITFQIKGWCVTASVAIGGFAVAYHKLALLIVGAGAVLGFYLVNCQFKMVQRAFINRNNELDHELRSIGIMEILKGTGNLSIAGTIVPKFGVSVSGLPYLQKIYRQLPGFWYEARSPNTFSLYLFILVCLAVEAITLL